METISKGPFLGLNNRLPAFALHKDKVGDFLSSTNNIDIDNAGNIRRRNAAERIQAITGAHSLHMTSETAGYLVIGSIMYAITLPTYTQTLFKVLTSNDPVYYVEDNGCIYYSNGTDSGRIQSSTWYPWGLPTPDTPTTSGIAGALPKGTYQIAVSYYNSVTKEEGGISASTNPAISGSTGGFRVPLPAATPGADKVLVYVSTTNGSIPMRVEADINAGTAYYDVVALATGRESNQRYEAPLPAGRPFMFNGCLCTISGSMIYEGSPFRPGYYLPAEGYIPFQAAVSNAVPAQNGIYVVADKTYWLPGTRMAKLEAPIQDVLPYGGVPATGFGSPTSPNVGWFGAQGIVVANQSGQVEALMSDNVALTAPASGVSAVFDGEYRRVVSCGWCMNLQTTATTQYSGYDFTSISGNHGTKADGLYVLSAVGAVDASFSLGKESFGSENEKHMPAVYLGYASAAQMSLTVGLPNAVSYHYPARSCSDNIDIHRVDTGKKLRANWFDLAIANLDGADFTLASVSFAPVASQRRI